MSSPSVGAQASENEPFGRLKLRASALAPVWEIFEYSLPALTCSDRLEASGRPNERIVS